jgi:hypothetical protein
MTGRLPLHGPQHAAGTADSRSRSTVSPFFRLTEAFIPEPPSTVMPPGTVARLLPDRLAHKYAYQALLI